MLNDLKISYLLIEELNIVDKISERNSQISNQNYFSYEITEEMKQKSQKILSSIDENKLIKFIILNLQKSIILEDEESQEVIKISSKVLEVNDISNLSDEEEKTNNNQLCINNDENIEAKEIKKTSLSSIFKTNEKMACKEKEGKLLNSVFLQVINSKNFSYFKFNRKDIFSKLEDNTNSKGNLEHESNFNKKEKNNFYSNPNYNTNLFNSHHNSNINGNSNFLKSISSNLGLKQANNNENFYSVNSTQNSIQAMYRNLKIYNNDSLYNLFNSECFDMHLIMYYLSTKDECSIIDVLINIIYSKCVNLSLFYIPQLCFLISNKKFYESIENYVLDRCVDQIKFSLIANWLLNSYIEHDDLQVIRKFDKFMQRVEMTVVNGRRATISNYRIFNSLYEKSDEDVVLNSLDKEFRLEYFDKINKFYNDLKSMCEKLKKYQKEDKLNPQFTRPEKLKMYLFRFNKKLNDLYKNVINQKNMHNNIMNKNNNKENIISNGEACWNNDEKNQQTVMDEKILNFKFSSKSLSLFRGYILPFDDNTSIIDEYNTLIVNFIPDQSFCFSTKARVPVKLTVETIKVFESEFWDDLIIKEEDKVFNNEYSEGQDEGKSVITKISKNNNEGIILFILNN